MSLFAKNLRFLRKQRGLNQDEVSGLFNKRGNTVGNWENGKSEPSIAELVKLADFFKIGLQQLLHQDLQERAFEVMDSAADPTSDKQTTFTYPVNENSDSLAPEASQDSFWLILRELRSISEKLDELKLIGESGLHKPGSDKSYH
ncbi:MAG: helix-turn-helix domain-containing protein [Chitinophagales bacterium]